MPVLLLIVGLAVLAVTVYIAMGHGGELSRERADYAPLDLGPVSAADVALLRPPSNGWGYNKEATDEALDRIAESVRERDVRIVALEQLVTDLSRDPAPVALGEPTPGARHRRAAADSGPGALAASPPAESDSTDRESTDRESTGGESGEPERPEGTTPPQPVMPPVVWPSTPAPSGAEAPDAAAEESTLPQPAVREASRHPEEHPGEQSEDQPEELRDDRQAERRQQPPPERSHG